MPIVYDLALSPFSQKVKIALYEKGITFERRIPALDAGEPEFIAANPRGEFPALVDDDFAVFDSTIILAYVEERWPQPPLLSSDPRDRATVRMVEEVCDTQLEAATFGMTEVIAFKRAEGDRGKAILEAGARDVRAVIDWLGRNLGERAYFSGKAFGYGDVAAFPFVNVAALYKVGPPSDTPLGQWLSRVRSRASVIKVIEEAKAAMEDFRSIVADVQSGKHPRQLRDHRLEWLVRAGAGDIVLEAIARGSIRLPRYPQ